MKYYILPGMAYTITITVHVYGQMLLGLPWFTRLGMRYAEPIPTRVNPIVNTSPFLLTHVFLGNAHTEKSRHKVLFFTEYCFIILLADKRSFWSRARYQNLAEKSLPGSAGGENQLGNILSDTFVASSHATLFISPPFDFWQEECGSTFHAFRATWKACQGLTGEWHFSTKQDRGGGNHQRVPLGTKFLKESPEEKPTESKPAARCSGSGKMHGNTSEIALMRHQKLVGAACAWHGRWQSTERRDKQHLRFWKENKWKFMSKIYPLHHGSIAIFSYIF